VRCVEHGTGLDESTATLMAAREVALVPTFAVVEQLLSGQVGVITPGAQADLVLWNGNPLEDPELLSDPTNAVLVIQAGQIVKDLR
jgi:imidazolonepropionase-like amidohydrolase